MLGVLLCNIFAWTPLAEAIEEELTLTIEYVYDDDFIEDAEVEIYLVATLENGKYVLTEQFADLDVEFEDLTTNSSWREEGELIEEYVHDEHCNCEDGQCTDENGFTTFCDLEYGIYYVDVEDVSYGDGTLISSPVLITLPMYDDESNTYVYDVIMQPKVMFIEEPDNSTTTTNKKNKNNDPDDPEDTEYPEEIEYPDAPQDLENPEIEQPPEEPQSPDDPQDPDVDVQQVSSEPKIPQTGTSAWLILPLAIGGLVLIIIGLFGLGKKRTKP